MTASARGVGSSGVAFGAGLAVLAGVVVVRFVASPPDAFALAWMLASLLAAIGLQLLLAALRVTAPVRLLYAYLATPYFANRAFGEVWLGPSTELSAGTFAPLLFGDAVLMLVLVRERVRPPILALVAVAWLALPAVNALGSEGFAVGAFAYQYLVLVRWILVATYVAKAAAGPRPAITAAAVVVHLGIIFGVMAALSGFAAVATGARFGFPGWGANVYANALTVVAVLSAWLARGRRRWTLGAVVAACLFGIVGSGTRFALVAVAVGLAFVVLLRLVPARARAGVVASLIVVAASVATLAPGWVLGPLGDLNPRLRTVGGVTFDRGTQLADVLTALGRESTVRTRLTLWQGSWRMFVERPLGGVGWGQWNWRKADHGVGFPVLLDPHNGYLWWIAEGGAVAILAATAALWVWLARFRAAPFHLALLLVLFLELTNANVQKGLFGVLAAVLAGMAWSETRPARVDGTETG